MHKDATITNTDDDGPGSFEVILSAPTKDRDGDTLLPDEWNEAARNGADHRRPLRTANDDLQPLNATLAHRDDEPPARLQLVVQRRRQLGRRGRDGDGVEGRELR